MDYRLAEAGDEAGIAQVQVRTWQAAYRGQIPDDFLDSLSVQQRTAMWRVIVAEATTPDRGCLVAEEGGRIVGFAHYSASRDDGAAPGTGELTAIYLLDSHWDRGIGRALLERAVDLLTGAGFGAATLWVLDTNVRARRFYEAAGWAPDGASQASNQGTFSLIEVRYRRELTGPSQAEGGGPTDLPRAPNTGPRRRALGGAAVPPSLGGQLHRLGRLRRLLRHPAASLT